MRDGEVVVDCGGRKLIEVVEMERSSAVTTNALQKVYSWWENRNGGRRDD